jgi:hypothetical protein
MANSPNGGIGAGLATVFGALPLFDPGEWASFVTELLPQLTPLPAARPGEQSASFAASQVRDALSQFSQRSGPVVLSLTGPITTLLRLRRSGTETNEAAHEGVRQVRESAAAMLAVTDELAPDAPVVLMLDEPLLRHSEHPTYPLGSDDIVWLLDEVADQFSAVAQVGVQVNGSADWTSLLRSSIGVLGVPVTASLEGIAAELGAFLERGGLIAWGAVPTNEPLGASADRLWRRLSEQWRHLGAAGIDPLHLREQSIITTAGELADFGVGQAERAVHLAQDLATRVLRQVNLARLGIGA